MLASVKTEEGRGRTSAGAPGGAGEAYTLAELRATLAPHSGLPLVFEYGGRTVHPGYHVTEVKSGWFAALDCGANPENWREAFIQLWDVPEGSAHMPVGKFLSIIGKVLSEIDLDQDTRLTFEVSDGVAPIELHRALAVEIAGDAVRVRLGNVPASCKPRDRWLEGGAPAAAPCCGVEVRKSESCG